MTTHTKSELVLLGRLEDSLGDRQRAANGVTPDETASRATLAEMIDLERRIDGRMQVQRAAVTARRVHRRRRWWQF
jgi:hypothetical protein